MAEHPNEPAKRTRRVRAAEATNTLQPASYASAVTEERSNAPDALKAEARGAAPQTASQLLGSGKGDPPPAGTGSSGRFESVPEQILDRYYRIGEKYFLDNGELAFTNHGSELTTKSENAQIVRDLLEIAQHNGHTNLIASGTERFRREVWGQALRLGLDVQGYTPTEHDEKQWVRKWAREDAALRSLDRGGADQTVTRPAPAASTPPAAEPTERSAAPRSEPAE